MSTLTAADLDHFNARGYVYVHDAFSAEEAAAMREVVWRALARGGLRESDPSTWTAEFVPHLQALKRAPEFAAVGSARTVGAIDDLLGTAAWKAPGDWGAFFLLFPTKREWSVPYTGWHCDHDYAAPLDPLNALKVHAMFGDVAPRAGGMTIVAGSHRVVARYFAGHPAVPGSPGAARRKAVMKSHPYLVDLGTDGGREARMARFFERDEDVDGLPLRVVELTAMAGDVILIHPLVLHTRPTNAGTYPRLLLNKDLYP
ncbi:MAG TPA: phytanoyl-CoA dioxygenase family protein [Acidimicrobiales bacterium]|nr:phytanoyl-CoA dioxygenase family protein [Acidimicrobiales bacterium]